MTLEWQERQREIDRQLTAPGAPFELVTEKVRGHRMGVFKQRPRSLRDELVASGRHGARPYLVFDGGEELSFSDHARAVRSLAWALHARYGVREGDRVAILADNRPEWILAFWAAIRLGAIPVGLNGWWSGDEIRHGLDLVAPALLVADAVRLQRLDGPRSDLPVLEMGSSFAGLCARDAATPPEPDIHEDDPALILFTSGTTGRPKAAVISHRSVLAAQSVSRYYAARSALMAGQRLEDVPRSPRLLYSPLFHVSGLHGGAIATLCAGVTGVWLSGRFEVAKVLRLTREYGVRQWGGVPTHLRRLLQDPEFAAGEFSQIRAVTMGGAVVSPDLQRLVRAKLPRASLSVGYGCTETSAAGTFADAASLERHPDCVGTPLPTIELSIRDSQGRPLPPHAEGHVAIRGPVVMSGYWNDPESTAAAFAPDGALVTEDIGSLRPAGLFLASRKRDLIIRGGENVYPIEIENRLEEHPGVAEAAVVGVPDEELGEVVQAVVVAREGAAPTPEALQAFVAAKLACFKVPARVVIRSEPLPRNAAGKVMKHLLSGEREDRAAGGGGREHVLGACH